MLNDIYHAIDPVLFSIGPVSVRWYGIAYLIGFACAAYLMYATARRWKIKFDTDALLTIMACVLVGIIVGARLGWVLFYGAGYFLDHPLDAFNLTMGGMSFHGGLVGALISGIIAAKMTKIPYLTLADLGCIGAPLGLFFGRCANFINGELWGSQTDAPWGVVFGGSAGMVPRHPSQLYEALLEGVVIFVVLFVLSRRLPPRPRGTFFGLFLLMYGCFRFGVEFVREPDPQLGYLLGEWLTMGQVLSIPLLIVGIAVLVYTFKTRKPQQGLEEAQVEVQKVNNA